MKKLISFLIILFLINCNEKKDNDNNNLLALFLLTQRPASESTSDLNTPVGRAVSVSGVISNISSSVANVSNTSNFTMKDRKAKELENLQLFAIHTILSKGKEAAESKVALRKLVEKQTETFAKKIPTIDKRLTAWSSATTDSEGFTSYTFSGTVSGGTAVPSTTDARSFTNTPTTTCNITVTGLSTTGSNRKGTAKFTDGSFKTKTGSVRSSATVEFTNYGTLYGDPYKLIAIIKKYNGTPVASFSLSTASRPTCASLQAYYTELNTVYNAAELTGTLSYNSTNDFTVTTSNNNITIAGTFTSTSNSTNGVTISQNGQTASFPIANLVYRSVSAYTFTASTQRYSGKFTITVTGTVGGSAVNETIVVDFDT